VVSMLFMVGMRRVKRASRRPTITSEVMVVRRVGAVARA
jgi:hypothetical protein